MRFEQIIPEILYLKDKLIISSICFCVKSGDILIKIGFFVLILIISFRSFSSFDLSLNGCPPKAFGQLIFKTLIFPIFLSKL